MRRNQLLLCLVFSLCLNEGCAINPISGEEDFMLYPEQHDIAIGRKYAPEAEKQLKGKIPDEELQNYIDTVGQKIARISHRPDWEYHFIAVQDESINALALPGGYVFITKGLLAKLTTEAQLASILAHEVAHAVARDSAAAISREIGIGILFAAAVTQDVPQSALEAANITRQILGLQYSRDDEQAADLAGLDYMVRAGYNPQGMIETMQVLQDEQKVKPVEFFSTHPNPQNRINYLTQKIQAKYQNLVDVKIGKENYHRNALAHLKENQTR
jgi:predicted Zn-dependent protease